MKLALECSTNLLELVQPLADFDWILAHKYLEDEDYASYYKESTQIKFIDNSVNEVGEPVSIEDMKKIHSEIGGYVVSPDWIGNLGKTLEVYKECVKIFGEQVTVGVLQGATFECLSLLNEYKGIVAVPYDIGSSKKDLPGIMALRRALVISNIPQDRVVHLLGLNTLDEFSWYRGRGNVMTIDTGVPVLLGLRSEDILDTLESKEKPTYNQMEGLELTQVAWTGICRNVALLRRYLP